MSLVQSFILGHKSQVFSDLRSMPVTGSLKHFFKLQGKGNTAHFYFNFQETLPKGEGGWGRGWGGHDDD